MDNSMKTSKIKLIPQVSKETVEFKLKNSLIMDDGSGNLLSQKPIIF